MAITKTIVKFANITTQAQFAGDKSEEFVRNAFVSEFGWIANALVTSTINGEEKTYTFTENTGGKGK